MEDLQHRVVILELVLGFIKFIILFTIIIREVFRVDKLCGII